MLAAPTFQSTILKLQQYWADKGCILWQPYHTELGAGTMNPATYLRVLGPEPWWVAYVEPSFRPADGRYGENPNRWQHYYQFQVILKPDPGNPQELYLDSLVALGIDPERHDIRFVEDNWEAPPIGAWGLGWEVWLDGQEITQYTYFQQAGGLDLDPVSVEITYGLERIALALQGADSFIDLQWDDHLTYGEINLSSEVEFSRYNFEVADVDRLRILYENYEAEAEKALQAGLIQPAHDYVMKCSHAFNLLDARGAVGVTERMALFGRMRQLSLRVAQAYLEERQRQEYPLLGRWQTSQDGSPASSPSAGPDRAADFLLEIGTEELPAGDLSDALAQLEADWPALLIEHRLEHSSIQVLGTPRRLVLLARNLASHQADMVQMVKGPPAEKAFDQEGNPTPAAQGFARSKGVALDNLRVEDVEGGKYVVAEVRSAGMAAAELLTEQIPALLTRLRFSKSMRWNESGVTFSRPVRWLLAIHGNGVVPVQFAGLRARSSTRPLRFDSVDQIEVESASGYLSALGERGIVLDPSERRRIIWERVTELADQLGGEVPHDERLLSEVANLVEKPTVFSGSFEPRFLSLPKAVLESVMKSHQRYFPVQSDGKLMPHFIAVRNGGRQHLEQVIQGNEKVLKARFSDAEFFVSRDLERPLHEYLPDLERLSFETTLGSMRAKSERVDKLVSELAVPLELSADTKRHAKRAAELAKADLATQMVVEMTSLQGQIGRIYALRSGEPEQVAQAIEEHYLPRFSGDQLPGSRAGLAVAIADRIDSLVGLFAVGMQPSGAGDPFALRRMAIGLLEILLEHDQPFDLRAGARMAAGLQPVEVSDENLQECLAFVRKRLQTLLLARGFRHDVVEAVLAEQWYDPAAALRGVRDLERWVEKDIWPELLDNFARCVRITRDLEDRYPVEPERYVEPAEQNLHQALLEAREKRPPISSVDSALSAFEPLIPRIQEFFDQVLVMADDPDLRRNRLGLLQQVAELSEGALDLSHMEGF